VRLVWASLWSDRALPYRQEIGLDVRTSAMTVLVQEMILGERSGIIFGRSPTDPGLSVVLSGDGDHRRNQPVGRSGPSSGENIIHPLSRHHIRGHGAAMGHAGIDNLTSGHGANSGDSL
jgi:hypothetical protein